MIKTETVVINGYELVRTYSDSDVMIEREGVLYAEAVDPVGSGRTYTETGESVPDEIISDEDLGKMVKGALE